MDRLRAMTTFVAIGQTGSLSAASRHLALPLTTVSRQLASLEAYLGTTLVSRSTRHLALTQAGETYLEACRRLLEDLDGTESQIMRRSNAISGDIEITAPIVFGRLHVLPIVSAFLGANPLVNCRLTLNDRNVDLARDNVDVAIRIGQLNSSSLIASKVGSLSYLTCAAPAYLEREGTPQHPKELSRHSCIAFSGFTQGSVWTYRSKRHGLHTIRLHARFATNTAEAAIDAALEGLGIVRVLSYQAASALAKGRLRVVLDEFDDTLIPVSCVHRAARIPKPQVKSFVAFATKALRTTMASLG